MLVIALEKVCSISRTAPSTFEGNSNSNCVGQAAFVTFSVEQNRGAELLSLVLCEYLTPEIVSGTVCT